ncbi:MAG: pyrroloquinoline quinone-dependent dehydrogenase [Myxococcales bacterium]|nr:pyrroloquinoline quinone-dependent dehydrogenase [Myxococcales bacterium]
MSRIAGFALVVASTLAVVTPGARARAEGAAAGAPSLATEWRYTEGAPGGGRYSPLADIGRDDAGKLELVWSYRHGDYFEGSWPLAENRGSAFEATPLVVGGRLYVTTPTNRVVALDAATGRELWTFDPELERGRAYANKWINRGVAYWSEAAEASSGGTAAPCRERLFLATLDARLIALDAASGERCQGFGTLGEVDLTVGIAPLHDPWEYNVTSPGTVVGDVVVVGSAIADTLRPDEPPGDVRAFDVRTGALRWTFHTIPHEGEPGHETWKSGTALTGAANVWSTMVADLERNLVFLPVTSASPDFWGGDRPGDNLYSDSVVALDAATGAVRWHFQTVHHDLWDYDLAAPPVLARLTSGPATRDGAPRDVVIQATKHGFVFVLDRDTGLPVFPVEERPVPASDMPGEHASPTQPFPTAPPPLVPQRVDPSDLYAPTPAHLEACRAKLAPLRNEGLFTPPSPRGSITYPYTAGGANWSGAAFDPVRQLLVVPANNVAHVIHLEEVGERATGGGANVWPLRGVTLRNLRWLLTGKGTGQRFRLHPMSGRTLFAIDGTPCTPPPWGMLVGVDLTTGEIAWRASSSTRDGDPGSAVFGPALATASGLVFHGGTREAVLRVHDAETGERLATYDLPAGLHAGPITYRTAAGRQLLVVAPGGHVGLGSKLGDWVMAFGVGEE